MNKREMIFGIAGVVVGGTTGFVIGYKLLEKKVQKKHDEKLHREVEQLRNTENGSEESDISETSEQDVEEYEEIVDDLQYAVDEESEDENMKDICDEGVEVTINKKHQKPKVLGKTQMDIDDPDLKYDTEELYYFMEDRVLLDANGQAVNEIDLIGNNLRRYGFMQGEGDLDTVWVRNYDYEVDYEVHRDIGSSSEMFGEG